MKSNVVHLKLEGEEASNIKKDLLNTQISILNILKLIRMYSQIRKDELKLQLKLNQKINEVYGDIIKAKEMLPKSQLPETLRKKEEIQEKTEEEVKTYSKDLEIELAKIKERLKALG